MSSCCEIIFPSVHRTPSGLEGAIEKYQPTLWIYSHTCDSFDYELFRTRIVCNPRVIRRARSRGLQAGYHRRRLTLTPSFFGSHPVVARCDLAGVDAESSWPGRRRMVWGPARLFSVYFAGELLVGGIFNSRAISADRRGSEAPISRAKTIKPRCPGNRARQDPISFLAAPLSPRRWLIRAFIKSVSGPTSDGWDAMRSSHRAASCTSSRSSNSACHSARLRGSSA